MPSATLDIAANLPAGIRISDRSLTFRDGEFLLSNYCVSCAYKGICKNNAMLRDDMGEHFKDWPRTMVPVEVDVPRSSPVAGVLCTRYQVPGLPADSGRIPQSAERLLHIVASEPQKLYSA